MTDAENPGTKVLCGYTLSCPPPMRYRMSAPRWIDKLRGLLGREDEASVDPAAQEQAGGAPVAASHSPEVRPSAPPIQPTLVRHNPAPAAASPQVQPQPRPAPPPRAPRPSGPQPKQIDGRALAEMALKQIGLSGSHFLQHASKNGLKSTPGLDHDIGLLLMSYTVVAAAMRFKHGEAASDALRGLRVNMKPALLAALRKHYHKMQSNEEKLGANMVASVDQMLAAADSVNPGGARPFENLYARLANGFGGEASPDDLHARFGGILSELCTKAGDALANAPTL
jgi:hypothetical protein